MPARTLLAAFGAVTIVTTLGACTSSGSGSAGSSGGFAVQDGAARSSVSAASGSAGGAASGGVPASKSGAAGVPGTAPAQVTSLDLGTARIRTVRMLVQVRRGDSVSARATEAEAIAQRAGGEVDADERTSGAGATATLLLRIPPEDLVDSLAALSRLGTEKSRHFSSQDVTAQVADVDSRVASAKVSIARLRELYGRATKVADVITLESELSTRESDLESLEAQQRALTAQTTTAAVTLTLTSPPRPVRHVTKPPTKNDHTGFLGGLKDGWDAFSGAAGAVATVVGAVIPFAVLFLVLGLIGRWAWPHLRPRRAPVVPTE